MGTSPAPSKAGDERDHPGETEEHCGQRQDFQHLGQVVDLSDP